MTETSLPSAGDGQAAVHHVPVVEEKEIILKGSSSMPQEGAGGGGGGGEEGQHEPLAGETDDENQRAKKKQRDKKVTDGHAPQDEKMPELLLKPMNQQQQVAQTRKSKKAEPGLGTATTSLGRSVVSPSPPLPSPEKGSAKVQRTKYLVATFRETTLTAEESRRTVVARFLGARVGMLIVRWRSKVLFSTTLNMSFILTTIYLAFSAELQIFVGSVALTDYYLPLISLLVSSLIVINGLSLTNFAIMKLVMREFYTWVLIMESLGFSLGYAAMNCWTFRGVCLGLNLFLYTAVFVCYDGISLKARTTFRYALLFFFVFFMIFVVLIYMKHSRGICDVRINLRLESYPQLNDCSKEWTGIPSLSVVDFTLNRSWTFLMLVCRMTIIAFQDVSHCILVQSPVTLKSSREVIAKLKPAALAGGASAEATSETKKTAAPAAEGLPSTCTNGLPLEGPQLLDCVDLPDEVREGQVAASDNPRYRKRRILRPVVMCEELTGPAADFRVIHLFLHRRLADQLLEWRRWLALPIAVLTFFNYLLYSVLPVPILFLPPSSRYGLSLGVIGTSIVLLESVIFGSNLFLAKRILSSFEAPYHFIKTTVFLMSVAATFCWEQSAVVVAICLTAGNMGNILIDAFPSKMHRIQRFMLLPSLLMIFMTVLVLALRIGENMDCVDSRWSFFEGMVSKRTFCARIEETTTGSSGGGDDGLTAFWTSLMTRSFSLVDLGVNNGMTYIFLCLRHVYTAIRFPSRLAMVKARVQLQEVFIREAASTGTESNARVKLKSDAASTIGPK